MSSTSSQPPFTNLTDLASERLGGKVLYATDDFFAEKENLIKPGRGIFIADKYTDRGKWMDGWESRRKRTSGHDFCIVQLATSGKIFGVDIDTNFFLGNHPPHASIEACNVPAGTSVSDLNSEKTQWVEILSKSPLNPGSQHFFDILNRGIYTHLKLHIYPDGGVARLKVYGEVFKDWSTVGTKEIDLAAAVNGAKSILCNDMFFSHMDNLIMPGRGINMGDGWETKRNRTPGNRDWVIVKLAHLGEIDKIVIDTAHFKGNYPDSFRLDGLVVTDNSNQKFDNDEKEWIPIIDQTKLKADHEHAFKSEIENKGPFTHVRLSMFPDGGISRMRLFGRITQPETSL